MGTDTSRSDRVYMAALVERYKVDLQPLLKYVRYFESKAGVGAASTYGDQGISRNSLMFPVYDGTLLSFIRDVKETSLLDRNYPYVYSKKFLKTVEDEKELIENSDLKDMENITAILSRYVLEGSYKAVVWTEGVRNGIFLAVLMKMKKNLDYWSRTLAIEKNGGFPYDET
ncbi:MAG: hypothetical protein IJT00_05670 [Lachnospiraceae bacterium]|nr:hypothetical protein [Lachnospiraceae bacterium]